MPEWQNLGWWLLVFGLVAGCVYWFLKAALAVRSIRATPVLADVGAAALAGKSAIAATPALAANAETAWPRLSVIIPACNEAATIEAAVRSQLAQDYPNIEFLLINDRSRDATGAIIDRLAAGDARVRALHIRTLPDGWLGKVHALHRGVQESSGEWLLFIDADVHLAPQTLREAVAYCVARDREQLALLPWLERSSFWLDVAMASFIRMGIIGSRPWAIEDPRSSASVGVGAFNLVRRDALLRTPGFEWLRMEVVDDIGLGQLLKKHGVRCTLALGRGRVSLRWYDSLGEMVRGVEKNAFAALARFSYLRLAAFVLIFPFLETAPLLAVALPHGAAWLHGLGAAATIAALTTVVAISRWLRQPVAAALLFPLGALLLAFALVRSGVLAKLRGGMLWRGTLYPTDALRQGQRYRFI